MRQIWGGGAGEKNRLQYFEFGLQYLVQPLDVNPTYSTFKYVALFSPTVHDLSFRTKASDDCVLCPCVLPLLDCLCKSSLKSSSQTNFLLILCFALAVLTSATFFLFFAWKTYSSDCYDAVSWVDILMLYHRRLLSWLMIRLAVFESSGCHLRYPSDLCLLKEACAYRLSWELCLFLSIHVV